MTSRLCPTLEDLSCWLDDQFTPSDQTEIGIHIDTCTPCQKNLEELTCREAYGLRALGGRPSRGSRRNACGAMALADQAAPSVAVANGRYSIAGRALPAVRLFGASSRDWELDRRNLIGRLGEMPLEPSTVVDDRTGDFLPGDTEPAIGRVSRQQWAAIPSYEVLEVIREGGMSVVYKARQRGLNRLVALKMIRGKEWSRPDHFARIRIEAEAVARLRHPNIVQIYEIGEVDGVPFLSLEFLEGGTLEDHLAGDPQPGKKAAELIVTLARAIQTAHDAGIIHRDLKPSNVLFTGSGTPRITDFGLAKQLESNSRQTESGQIMGTPCYMAPEQAMGHTRDVGPTADVYALGAVLYEMLTGRPPFKGETPIETMRQVVEDEVVPPRRLVPKVDRDLETVCLQCLKKEQARRYPSAVALAQDLECYLAGTSINARRTPLWERGVKLARRRPMATLLCTLSLIATIGLLGGWMRFSARQQEQGQREFTRRAKLRSATDVRLLEAQQFLTQERWSDAEPILTGIEAELHKETGFGELGNRVDELLKRCRQGRATEEARSEGEERLQTFRMRRNVAMFHETHFTGLALPSDKEAVRRSTWAALAVFAQPGSENSWAMGALPATLQKREREEIKEGCYQLLLILAQAVDEPDQALRLLDQAAELRPPTRFFHLRRADQLTRRGDLAAAKGELEKANALQTSSALDFFLSGQELYKRREWKAALSQFDEVLRIQPEHFWAHCLSAICDLQLSEPEQAKAELNACLQSEASFAWLYELRGFASYQVAALKLREAEKPGANGSSEAQVHLKAAQSDYDTALELLKKRPNDELRYALLVNFGLLWLERKEWDKAVADLESAIRLEPAQWQAHEMLAQVYDRDGKPDLAIEQFTQAIGLSPEMAALYRARAAVDLRRKKLSAPQRDRALSDLEMAIRLERPDSPFLAGDQTNRAELLHRQGRESEALSACAAALEVDPRFLDAHLLRIDVLRKLKRHSDVIRSCDVLLTQGKPSTELYELRALAKQELKDYEGAIEDNTLALAMRPRSAALLERRGGLFLITDAPRMALRDFEKAIDLDPTSPSSADAYLGRGLARATLGLHREAAADASRAVRMAEPTDERLYSAARIFAKAAVAATAEVKKSGQVAVLLVSRYEDQALEQLRMAIALLPAAHRPSFVRDVVQTDPALAVLRHRLRSLDLARSAFRPESSELQPQD
jgi:serine/threonine protein kinase/tetratricopeptide (TPR) repeat protein